MKIREQTENDTSAVRQVVLEAFGEPAEAGLVEALHASGDAVVSLVAEQEDGGITGHILFSKLQAPDSCLGLGPVSVTPALQNQGIGSALIRDGLARAKTAGWRAVFLLGEPAYYERFGFRTSTAEKFDTPYPKSYVMALELTPGALEELSGPLTYAEPFLALG